MAIKKKKFKKSSLLYNIKTSEDKTERNLNKGKSGLKPSFKKEKKKRENEGASHQTLQKLISGIRLLKPKFQVFCRFILLFTKVLLTTKELPE